MILPWVWTVKKRLGQGQSPVGAAELRKTWSERRLLPPFSLCVGLFGVVWNSFLRGLHNLFWTCVSMAIENSQLCILKAHLVYFRILCFSPCPWLKVFWKHVLVFPVLLEQELKGRWGFLWDWWPWERLKFFFKVELGVFCPISTAGPLPSMNVNSFSGAAQSLCVTVGTLCFRLTWIYCAMNFF